jgi:hypothetical protein
MIRKLLCVDCGHAFEIHPQDAADGFQMRKVNLTARKPENMNIEIHATGGPGPDEHQTIPVNELVCDHCNDSIPNGHEAVAVTMWDKNREETPGDWEQSYGTLI